MLVILVTTWTVLHLAVTESSDSSSGSPYTLGHMEEVLVGVEDWGRGIRMGKWNQSIIPVGRVHPYNEHWANLVTALQLKTGCNAVDIGANDGVNQSNVKELLKCFHFIQVTPPSTLLRPLEEDRLLLLRWALRFNCSVTTNCERSC